MSENGSHTRVVPFEQYLGGSPHVRTAPTLPAGALTVGELRRLAREAGFDMGDPRSDDEEREWIAKHEAGHAAIAHALGWTVISVDVGAGQTRCTPPETLHGAERDLELAVVAAAGAAFTGTHQDHELQSDRHNVRLLGANHMDFEEARARAVRLKTDRYVNGLYERLVAGLMEHGRLEGAELRRVLDDWSDDD